MIGKQVCLKNVQFMIVDKNCPTIRDVANWTNVHAKTFESFLLINKPKIVLITMTDPIHVVMVIRTYPVLKKKYFNMSKKDFVEFKNMVEKPTINTWISCGF